VTDKKKLCTVCVWVWGRLIAAPTAYYPVQPMYTDLAAFHVDPDGLECYPLESPPDAHGK
jgi:hypothetical protein